MLKKLYREFFYIPKYGKIQEKVMLTRVTAGVTVILLCLAAMGFTAYAYFSHSAVSNLTVISSATFEAKATVRVTDENGEIVPVNNTNYRNYSIPVEGNKTYYVQLEHTQRSTSKTGFVILTAANCQERYHTQQLGKDGSGVTEVLWFRLKPTADTTVNLKVHWGTSTYYSEYQDKGINDALYITNGEDVDLIIGGVTPPDNDPAQNDKPEEKPTEPTKPEEKPTEPTQPEETTPATEVTQPEETVPETETEETTAATEEADIATA